MFSFDRPAQVNKYVGDLKRCRHTEVRLVKDQAAENSKIREDMETWDIYIASFAGISFAFF